MKLIVQKINLIRFVRVVMEKINIMVEAVKTKMSMARLSAADKASLALSVLREGVSADHCLAAFYLLASGDRERGRNQLHGAAPADAEKVRAAFTE